MAGPTSSVTSNSPTIQGTSFVELTLECHFGSVCDRGRPLITGGVTFGLQVLPQAATLTMMGVGAAALMVMTVINLIRMKREAMEEGKPDPVQPASSQQPTVLEY